MKTIVTGGAGFIGSHLTERLLKDGHSVIVLDNLSTGRLENLAHLDSYPTLNIVTCDLAADRNLCDYFDNVDWVFHLAALADIVPSIERPDDYFKANVNGTFNVLEACRFMGIKRFVYAASSSCYGIPDQYPTPETAEINTQYPYALTKYLGENMVMHWQQVYQLPANSLRFFNVYGPRSRTSGTYGAVFGVFLAQKLGNQPFTVVGDGKQTRDFTFVSDIVQALIKTAESDVTGEIMNVGSSQSVSVNRLVELLKGEVEYIPKRPGEPDCTYADISKIKKLLGWKPVVTIKEGVEIMLENIDYWKNAPVWKPDTIQSATQSWFKYLDR